MFESLLSFGTRLARPAKIKVASHYYTCQHWVGVTAEEALQKWKNLRVLFMRTPKEVNIQPGGGISLSMMLFTLHVINLVIWKQLF